MQSTSGILEGINLMNAMRNSFRVEMLRFNYNAAELITRALEDYLKGPEFIKTVDGEKNTNENFKLNDKLVPLSELEDGEKYDYKPSKLYKYTPPTLFERVISKFTWNGQKHYPSFLDRNKVAPISFNEFFQLHGIVLKSKLIAINPYAKSGTYRIKDRKRFNELMARFQAAEQHYMSDKDAIAAAYADSKAELTSEKFWKQYLGI
jgi:hypothetical protein